ARRPVFLPLAGTLLQLPGEIEHGLRLARGQEQPAPPVLLDEGDLVGRPAVARERFRLRLAREQGIDRVDEYLMRGVAGDGDGPPTRRRGEGGQPPLVLPQLDAVPRDGLQAVLALLEGDQPVLLGVLLALRAEPNDRRQAARLAARSGQVGQGDRYAHL